jgi:hypothetical protein
MMKDEIEKISIKKKNKKVENLFQPQRDMKSV